MTKKGKLRQRYLTYSDGHEADHDIAFLQIVSMGNLPKVIETMSAASQDKQKQLMQMTDFKDRTALEIATGLEHFEIVEYLVGNFPHLMDEIHVHECLMLSISKGYFRIAEVLLDSPLTGGREEAERKRSYHMTKMNSKFDRDVTPLMLAAHCNEVDIIRLLLNRGEFLQEPTENEDDVPSDIDPLMKSLGRLHMYQALASEAYICLTSPDPILTAFLLSDKLTRIGTLEKEFKNEYQELVKQCRHFASDLLDMCQTSEEVKTILTQEATTAIESQAAEGANTLRKRNKAKGIAASQAGDNEDADFRLPRLEMAIKYHQKQFVAHPHCQHHLSTLWYKGTPTQTRQWHMLLKCSLTLGIVAALPVLAMIYWLYPKGKVADFMRSPRTKFMMHASMYVSFLLILFLESIVAQMFMSKSNDREYVKVNYCEQLYNRILPALNTWKGSVLRANGLSPLQWAVVVFVAGMLWGEVKQIHREGYRNYLSSLWNWIDIAMLNLLISSLLIRVSVVVKVNAAQRYFQNNDTCTALGKDDQEALDQLYWITADRTNWRAHDPILIAEALFAVANVLSFCRLSYILPVNEFLGPLQISVLRMFGQILRFGAIFIVIFLAFFCALTNLFWYYPDYTAFGGPEEVITTLFWALFGLGNAEDVECMIPNTSESCGHRTTEVVGTILYITYHLIMALVMLNMLIAMMTTSFQEINDDEDVEWKFARSQLWMTYFERGATLPLPLNLVPSPKSMLKFSRKIRDMFCPSCMKEKDQVEMPTNMLHLNRRAGIRKLTSTHESLMKTVVKRYLFKLQNEKEGEDGAEGELEEIKNDISSFRCDVLESIKRLNEACYSVTSGKLPNCRMTSTGSPDVFTSPGVVATGSGDHRGSDNWQLIQKRDVEIGMRMATLENRVEKLVGTFTEFFQVAKEAVQQETQPSQADGRQPLNLCNTQ